MEVLPVLVLVVNHVIQRLVMTMMIMMITTMVMTTMMTMTMMTAVILSQSMVDGLIGFVMSLVVLVPKHDSVIIQLHKMVVHAAGLIVPPLKQRHALLIHAQLMHNGVNILFVHRHVMEYKHVHAHLHYLAAILYVLVTNHLLPIAQHVHAILIVLMVDGATMVLAS